MCHIILTWSNLLHKIITKNCKISTLYTTRCNFNVIVPIIHYHLGILAIYVLRLRCILALIFLDAELEFLLVEWVLGKYKTSMWIFSRMTIFIKPKWEALYSISAIRTNLYVWTCTNLWMKCCSHSVLFLSRLAWKSKTQNRKFTMGKKWKYGHALFGALAGRSPLLRFARSWVALLKYHNAPLS